MWTQEMIVTATTDSPFFVKLVSARALPRETVKQWFQLCKRELPSGVLGAVQVNKPNFGIASVQLIHRKNSDGSHEYEIPLNRDVLKRELAPIKVAWKDASDQGDYTIETSASYTTDSRHKLADAVTLEQNRYDELCETLAKHQHSRWCRERQSSGWKYGLAMDLTEKTHPLLRPWEDLPESYKKVDFEAPKVFAKVLKDMGYTIVKAKTKSK
jgi:hypothetical protein